jgi:Fe-S-cluster containining protein
MKTKSELCLECLACCRVVKIPIGEGFIHDVAWEFCNARGFEIILEGGVNFVVIPHVCQHLGDDGCKIYEDRPVSCRRYDGRTDSAVNCLWGEDEVSA